MVGYILNDSMIHTGGSSLHLMFGMEFCYHCMHNDIDHYYCFLDLLSMSLAAKELTAVREKWQYIGEELGVGQSSLRHIRTKHSKSHSCLTEVFYERLRHHTTWGDVIAVLRSSCVGEFQLADHLEAKYYPSELNFIQFNLWKYCPG